MTQPIAGTYSSLVTLGAASDNPTTITATGLLEGGLLVSDPGLTVVNAGGIANYAKFPGVYNPGVQFSAGGSVTNQSGGTISGSYAIYATADAVTVVNAGSITGSSIGVDLSPAAASPTKAAAQLAVAMGFTATAAP